MSQNKDCNEGYIKAIQDVFMKIHDIKRILYKTDLPILYRNGADNVLNLLEDILDKLLKEGAK